MSNIEEGEGGGKGKFWLAARVQGRRHGEDDMEVGHGQGRSCDSTSSPQVFRFDIDWRKYLFFSSKPDKARTKEAGRRGKMIVCIETLFIRPPACERSNFLSVNFLLVRERDKNMLDTADQAAYII
jgi:hypothetical protein